MTNFMIFMMFVYSGAVGLSFMKDGSMGPANTILTVAITATSATLAVHSTTHFLNNDFVVIDDEEICYTVRTATTFTGLTRGCNDTKAQSHSLGDNVRNEPASVINQAVGFDLLETVNEGNAAFGLIRGAAAIPSMVKNVFTKLVMWDFEYLNNGAAVYIKYYFLYPISAGFVISLILFIRQIVVG